MVIKTLILIDKLNLFTDSKSPGSLTPLGRVVSGFPVTPRFGKMLALSMQHQGLMPHTINLVSALSVEQIILDPGQLSLTMSVKLKTKFPPQARLSKSAPWLAK